MQTVAIIEDDKVTSSQLRGWVEKALPGARIDQGYTPEAAEEAVKLNVYDLITLDIDLKNDQNAGVSIIKEATRSKPVPVLVVSGLSADLYRGVMKALDAWDYLEKPVGEQAFIQTLLHIKRLANQQKKAPSELDIDPLTKLKPTWRGERLNVTATQQRILNAIYKKRGEEDPTVTYEELFQYVENGKNSKNIKRQINQIRAAFEDIDQKKFECIASEYMKGYRWVNR